MDSNLTEELKTIESEKDVGVTFSTDLKFNLHINNVIKKSNQLNYWSHKKKFYLYR